MPILAILACLESNNCISVICKSWRRPIFSVPPYGLQQKWLQVLPGTTNGHVTMGLKSYMCPFLTYLYSWEYFCIQVVIFEKVTNFDTLKIVVFGKPPDCTSKLCNSLFWGLKGKREIKVLFVKFWWEMPQIIIFLSRNFGKGDFWHQWRLEIHKLGLNSISTSPCMCENVEFFLKLHFAAWKHPFLK